MKRPEFTIEQEIWICEIMDSWYFHWKNRMCGIDNTHNLGRAKEELKAILCGEQIKIDKLADIDNNFKDKVN